MCICTYMDLYVQAYEAIKLHRKASWNTVAITLRSPLEIPTDCF